MAAAQRSIEYKTLPGMLRHVSNTYRNTHAFNYLVDEEWRSVSTEAFLESVRRMALGLKALGLKKGECVGLLAQPSPFWLIADLAIGIAGGISVPLFTHISHEHFLFQVSDAEMQHIFVIGEQNWSLVQSHKEMFQRILTLDIPYEMDNLTDWHEVMRKGDALSEEDPELYANLADSVSEHDIATIIYTSGSTGIPKGVELTHENFVSQLHASRIRFPLDARKDRALSALPLAHVFERTLMYFYISTGITVYFCADIKKVGDYYRMVQPTMTAVVPRILEKIQVAMEDKVEASSGIQGKIARWAYRQAVSTEQGWWAKKQRSLANKLVFSKFREALGGKLRAVISGGAPLEANLCRFFWNIGVPIYQGYGLTESSPVIAANFPGHSKCGTVGLPFPGVEVQISEHGEVLARGPNIMRGYHTRPEATAVCINSGGWLHTGDTGLLDSDGYLVINGRIKEIFKTSGGKMVSPVRIEQALAKNPLIETAMVIAEGKPFVSCLFFPDFDALERLKKGAKKGQYTDEEFLDSPLVRQQMNELLAQVNNGLSRWENVRKYRFVPQRLTVDGGDLTPTLKIRRKIIQQKYAPLIDSMYHDVEEMKEKE